MLAIVFRLRIQMCFSAKCSKPLLHFLAVFLPNSGLMQPTWDRDGEMRQSLFLFRSLLFSSPKLRTGDEYLDLALPGFFLGFFWGTDPSQGFLENCPSLFGASMKESWSYSKHRDRRMTHLANVFFFFFNLRICSWERGVDTSPVGSRFCSSSSLRCKTGPWKGAS